MATAKKIMHIITGLKGGGAEAVLVRLCRYDTDLTTHCVVSLSDEGKWGEGLRSHGIQTYFLGMGSSVFGLWKIFSLVRIIRHEQPDIVQTWMYHADFLGGIAARLAGVKRIFWGIRTSDPENVDSSKITGLISRVCAFLSSSIPEKIICCAYRAQSTHKEKGYCPRKMIVIQNGYDFSKFHPDVMMRESIRNDLGVRSGDFLIGMIARYSPCKDHQNLLEALALLKGKMNFICLLVGENIKGNEVLWKVVLRLGLENNVRLLEFRKDIQSIMNALDIHVLSSLAEGFPNVLAEAMACGIPAISTDVGDAKYILGDPAMCCPPRSPSALAELIMAQKNKWKKEAEWAEFKNIVRTRITEHFSLQGMVEGYNSVWFPEG